MNISPHMEGLGLSLYFFLKHFLYLPLLNFFVVSIVTREELLVFYRAPPLVADRGMLTRYGGYRGNKIPGADQN